MPVADIVKASLFALALILIVAYLIITVMDSHATGKITSKEGAIREFLKEYGQSLYAITWHDAAPCQVRYSLLPEDGLGLPSRVMWRKLREVRDKETEGAKIVAIERLLDMCRKSATEHQRKTHQDKSF